MKTPYQTILQAIYQSPADYVSWPTRPLLLLPGIVREKYHRYPDNVLIQLKSAGIPVDSRSNGPAVCAFLLAGGQRPQRETGKGWNIHHIYDGNFPYNRRQQTTHAIKNGDYFTQAAGLVALHPLAHAAAEEFAEFAWWLRREAFTLFRFDPDKVFTDR